MTGGFRCRAALPAAVALCLCLAVGPVRAEPEFSLIAEWISGDYDTETSTVSEILTMRLAGGRSLRYRASLSVIRASGYEGFTRIGSGQMVPLPRKRQGENGSGSGGDQEDPVQPGTGLESTSAPPAGAEAEADEWQTGLGDLWFGLSAPLAGGGAKLHRVGAVIDLKAPTASEETLGTGEWDARLGFTAERYFWSLTLYGGAGWTRVGDPEIDLDGDPELIDLENVWDAYLGLETESVGPGLRWSFWGEGWTEAIDGAEDRALVGIALSSSGAVRWSLSATAGLTPASPDLGFSLRLSWGSGITAGQGAAPWHLDG